MRIDGLIKQLKAKAAGTPKAREERDKREVMVRGGDRGGRLGEGGPIGGGRITNHCTFKCGVVKKVVVRAPVDTASPQARIPPPLR